MIAFSPDAQPPDGESGDRFEWNGGPVFRHYNQHTLGVKVQLDLRVNFSELKQDLFVEFHVSPNLHEFAKCLIYMFYFQFCSQMLQMP